MVMGYDLYSTLVLRSELQNFYDTAMPTACPRCGWPLREGATRKPGVLFCPQGDFLYPADWDSETMSGM